MLMKYFALVIVVLLTACSLYNVAARQLDLSTHAEQINFDEMVGGSWERVCIFEPYSVNEVAQKQLGFQWGLESKSTISYNDSISLLVFASDRQVIDYYEVSRGVVDFASLGNDCIARQHAVFEIYEGAAVLAKK